MNRAQYLNFLRANCVLEKTSNDLCYGIQNLGKGFFKRAAMELWAVETTKWAVVNLKLGS